MKPLVAAAYGKPTERMPVWFLRQAGRYLPEYMEIRSKMSFLELCQNPPKAAEVTLQPLKRFDVDAAIIFSDILVIPVAMGQSLTFDKGHGPVLKEPVRSGKDIAALKPVSARKDLGYVAEAIELTVKGLADHQTMIGFAGAPFTVASYMVEGGGSKNFTEMRKLYYQDEQAFVGLLEMIANATEEYLGMQVEAGAETLMLFDTWANQIPAVDYARMVLPVVKKLAQSLKPLNVPVVYFPGQGAGALMQLHDLDVDVIAVDWRIPLNQAIQLLDSQGMKVSVQGNLDPQIFLADEATVRARTRDVIEAGKAARGHIFNVGHGLLPFLPPDALNWAISEIRSS